MKIYLFLFQLNMMVAHIVELEPQLVEEKKITSFIHLAAT
jgi:hypothetical protein